jgi:stage III sporulation protein AG
MEGVGKVSVMITYSQSSEIIPMQNETSKVSKIDETDSDGGTRVTEQMDSSKEVIYSDGNKVETQTVKAPVVQGAIVIAEGASNATVKTNIVSAVEAITGVATYKVQVFEMN